MLVSATAMLRRPVDRRSVDLGIARSFRLIASPAIIEDVFVLIKVILNFPLRRGGSHTYQK